MFLACFGSFTVRFPNIKGEICFFHFTGLPIVAFSCKVVIVAFAVISVMFSSVIFSGSFGYVMFILEIFSISSGIFGISSTGSSTSSIGSTGSVGSSIIFSFV